MFIVSNSGEQFRFILTAGNGQTILHSEQYTTKTACMGGIDSVKNNSQTESRYDLLTAANGKLYFNLMATNGQVIGTSQMYESEDGRANGIKSVMENAADDVEDQTV
jgi:uncharacterized protein